MNLDLGVKLVWILIIGMLEWWNKVLLKKYLKGNYKSCIYGQLETKKGSHIWNILKAITMIMQSKTKMGFGKWKINQCKDGLYYGEPTPGAKQ
jgi:hypothetical protein